MNYLKTLITMFLIICVGTSYQTLLAQQQQLHLAGDHDASLLPGTGMLQIGETDAPNLLLDGNEILARNNGAIQPYS